MAEGDAILALAAAAPASKERGELWAGFCYISVWEGGRFVSTSALIVPPRFRGRGIARLLKEAALRLAGERYPGARPFGLSTSPAVVKINRELGLREARYAMALEKEPAPSAPSPVCFCFRLPYSI